MSSVQNEAARRPLATREKRWAKSLAVALNRGGITPNAISLSSLAFAVIAGLSLWQAGTQAGGARAALFLLAAAAIQLRLLCNMLDGMVAIEGGRRTAYGEIYNDMPDRFADLVILVGAGYGLAAFSWGRDLGWTAGALAVLTAYVRLLGASMGTRQYFSGPMAKPHRMAVMTVASILSCFEPLIGWNGQLIAVALAIVALGSIVTLVHRTSQIVAEIASR
jgi:phosphatidylglycerophosphate synthase